MNLLKRFGTAITSIIGVVTALVGAFMLCKQEPDAVTISLLALGIGAVIVSLGFVRLKKRTTKSSITGESIVERAYSPRARHWALIGLIAVPLVVAASSATWLHMRSLPSTKVRVLIAEFDGPEPKKYRVTENILRRLREATSKYDDVEIEALGEVITEQQGSKVAREKGKDKKANIVLWGWYAATSLRAQTSVHFEVLNLPSQYKFQGIEQTVNAEIAQLETFSIQTQFSSKMSYLTLFTAGLIRYEAKDYDAALSFFDKALAGANFVNEVIDPAAIYFYRATSYYIRSNYDLALADYDHSIQLRPNSVDALYNRGAVYQKKGDYDRAILDFAQAIQFKPDFAGAYYNRGNAYYDLKKVDQAIADFDRAIKLDQQFVDAYFNRGNAHRLKGDYVSAIADFDHAIRLNSIEAKFYVGRGIVYTEKNKLSLALSDFDHAIRIRPDAADAYNSRGVVYSIKKEYSLANLDYSQALKIKPDHVDAHYNRGVDYFKIGEYNQAINDFNSVIRLKADDGNAYAYRGHAYYHIADYDRAILDYDQAIRLEFKNADVYFDRGLAHAKKHNDSAAIADFQKVFELTQMPSLRENALAELRKLGVKVPPKTSVLK